jgi:hypothetical protein
VCECVSGTCRYILVSCLLACCFVAFLSLPSLLINASIPPYLHPHPTQRTLLLQQQNLAEVANAELQELKRCQQHLGKRLDRIVGVMQGELLSPDRPHVQDSTLLALAELKQIKDILGGLLPLDEAMLMHQLPSEAHDEEDLQESSGSGSGGGAEAGDLSSGSESESESESESDTLTAESPPTHTHKEEHSAAETGDGVNIHKQKNTEKKKKKEEKKKKKKKKQQQTGFSWVPGDQLPPEIQQELSANAARASASASLSSSASSSSSRAPVVGFSWDPVVDGPIQLPTEEEEQESEQQKQQKDLEMQKRMQAEADQLKKKQQVAEKQAMTNESVTHASAAVSYDDDPLGVLM